MRFEAGKYELVTPQGTSLVATLRAAEVQQIRDAVIRSGRTAVAPLTLRALAFDNGERKERGAGAAVNSTAALMLAAAVASATSTQVNP